jgi:hypothetical protein
MRFSITSGPYDGQICDIKEVVDIRDLILTILSKPEFRQQILRQETFTQINDKLYQLSKHCKIIGRGVDLDAFDPNTPHLVRIKRTSDIGSIILALKLGDIKNGDEMAKIPFIVRLFEQEYDSAQLNTNDTTEFFPTMLNAFDNIALYTTEESKILNDEAALSYWPDKNTKFRYASFCHIQSSFFKILSLYGIIGLKQYCYVLAQCGADPLENNIFDELRIAAQNLKVNVDLKIVKPPSILSRLGSFFWPKKEDKELLLLEEKKD